MASLERKAAALRAKRRAWEATFEAEHGEAASEEQKASSTVWCGIGAKIKHYETLITAALQAATGAATRSDDTVQADIFLSMPRRVAGAGKRARRVGVTTETSDQTETQSQTNERTAGRAGGGARDARPPLAVLDVAAKGCILLRGLSREELAAMAVRMVPVEAAAGQEVVREGEAGEACWVVARGEFCSVHARLPGAPLQKFTVGDVVGAVALLHSAPMVASVACRSRGGGTLWRLERRDYRAALCSSKAAQRRGLGGLLRGVALLRGLDEAQLNWLADEASLESLAAGATLVKQGSKADALYVVRRGHVLCRPQGVDGGKGGRAEPFKLGPGALLGESALAAEAALRVRAADVWAEEPCELLRLPAAAFRGLGLSSEGLAEHARTALRVHLPGSTLKVPSWWCHSSPGTHEKASGPGYSTHSGGAPQPVRLQCGRWCRRRPVPTSNAFRHVDWARSSSRARRCAKSPPPPS